MIALARITIWHNISTDAHTRPVGRVDGYAPGHALVPVATYVDPVLEQSTLDRAYRLFNLGEDPTFFVAPDARALEYRRRGNRSLSTGDVVQVSTRQPSEHPVGECDTWWACASFGGWKRITAPEFFAIGASCSGTTSLDVSAYNRF